jgi:hypothetical protein
MSNVLVYKPATERLLPERLAALQDLENEIADGGFTVDTEYREQRPGTYGVTWWEVVLIYLGTQGLDNLTSHAFDTLLEKLADVAKAWARRRFKKKLDAHSNPRPEFFAILDDDGKVLRAWKIDARGESDETANTLPHQPRPLHGATEDDS